MEVYDGSHQTVDNIATALCRKAFGQVGPYEQLDGTVSFAVDPTHPANQLITDLKLAPRDVSGRVHFSADWRILRPVEPQRGNHRLLFDILNRGRGPGLRNLNSAQDVAPTEPLDPGNGFLMRQGYTVAWCGWQHDVPDAPGLMRLRAPEALTLDGPISGKITVTFQPTTSACVQFLADRLHRPYPTNNLEDRHAMLTEQDHEDAPERVIPREQWSFARLENGCVVPDAAHVYMASGFVPGKVYQVIYPPREHRLSGVACSPRVIWGPSSSTAALGRAIPALAPSMPTASVCPKAGGFCATSCTWG